MTARVEVPVADAAMASIEGERAANVALERIAAGTSDPELLTRAVLRALAADGRVMPAPPPTLAGFLRRVQKSIEEGAGR